MIDYSVFMMGNPTGCRCRPKRRMQKTQVSEIMPFSQFVKHIADHNGVFTRGTVKGSNSRYVRVPCRDASGGQKSNNWQN